MAYGALHDPSENGERFGRRFVGIVSQHNHALPQVPSLGQLLFDRRPKLATVEERFAW
jgi:hypothetical protein